MLGNVITINLDWQTVLIWAFVGLVAGFLASHVAMGRGLGIVGDVVVGIIGALLAGILSGIFHWSIAIVGHPIISAMIMAFIGAVILLLIVRLLGAGRGSRRPYWS
jgi:uncharacterized membrane protein YeaQ/YmgE (transglycosylase-associated protein family)